jgi:1-deoxy-D-xylulose-5-phosphate reductoisomerase
MTGMPSVASPGEHRPIRVALLGSTGSIGESTLAVLARHPGRFQVRALTANRSVDVLARQARAFGVDRVVVADEAAFRQLASPPSGWRGGRQAVLEVAEDP